MDVVDVRTLSHKTSITLVDHHAQERKLRNVTLWAELLIFILSLFLFLSIAHAQPATGGINVERLATAIYWAEGGTKTRHPYGILAKYKHTTPRQACINTIKHALRDWNGKGDFIVFLGKRYCPVGAANDPWGLNKNWVRNVSYFYRRIK